MRKHSVSHGAAVLVCTVTSGILVQLMRLELPGYLRTMNYYSSLVTSALHLPYDAETFGVIMLTAILACIWGAAFALAHNDVK